MINGELGRGGPLEKPHKFAQTSPRKTPAVAIAKILLRIFDYSAPGTP
jgi:hypothetical protein